MGLLKHMRICGAVMQVLGFAAAFFTAGAGDAGTIALMRLAAWAGASAVLMLGGWALARFGAQDHGLTVLDGKTGLCYDEFDLSAEEREEEDCPEKREAV